MKKSIVSCSGTVTCEEDGPHVSKLQTPDTANAHRISGRPVLTADTERRRGHVAVGLGHELAGVHQLGRLDDQLVLLALRDDLHAVRNEEY